MLELDLENGKVVEDKMYSKLIGKKLLARVKAELGDEVLVQFGFTKTVLARMYTR